MGIKPRTFRVRDQCAKHYTTKSSCIELLKFLNIIPIHFEQNLAHSKSVDVALIVRAGEICFGQNLAHSKSVDIALIVRAGDFCFGQNLAHSKNEVKKICRC